VDAVLEHVFPEVNVTAPAQLSFAGCAYVKIGMQKKESTMIGIRTIGIRTAMDFIGWTWLYKDYELQIDTNLTEAIKLLTITIWHNRKLTLILSRYFLQKK